MPEREVFATELNEQEWLVSYLREAMKMAEKLVPESRLLAAEARVREVEAEMLDTAQQAMRIRAERDALVPLAWWGLQEALWFVPAITPPTDEQIAQARAILAREET